MPTLTLSEAEAKNLESRMTFNHQSRVVLTIDSEGRLIPGKDLSMDEVTQGVFAALATSLPKYAEIERLRAENARLREALEWYEERARLGRMTDAASGDARYEMIQDGGSIARAALQPKE